jgi:hypothetical protein
MDWGYFWGYSEKYNLQKPYAMGVGGDDSKDSFPPELAYAN